MEKWYVAVADYACKTSKGIKTKNNINCLEAQLQTIATLYNNISTEDLYTFQYPIYQSCSNFAVTYTTFGFGLNRGVGSFSIILDGNGTSYGSVNGTESDLRLHIQGVIAANGFNIVYETLGDGIGFTLTSPDYTLIQYRILLAVIDPATTESEVIYETFCNTQAQNGELTQSNIVCLLAKLAEGVAEGTGQNVTPNYLMWGTDMVNDILDYGSGSNEHIKWRF